MIGRLSGMLIDKNPLQLLVDCNGVGYEVSVPMSTFYNLPSAGEKITLLTHLVVREDAQLLYGFGTAQLLELKGKLGADIGAGTVAQDSNADVLNALLALGYSEKEAVLALKQVPAGSSVSDGIRHALKALSKG